MTRSDLEHLIRAAGAISGDDHIVIIGSQSILGQFPDAPASLRRSMEADLFPRGTPALSELVDGALGEGSLFHEQFGYYAQGVSEETARLPKGWQSRLVRIANTNTGGVEGLCLEVHDLAISKYIAGRTKDREFTRELGRYRMTNKATLLQRLRGTKLETAMRKIVQERIESDFRSKAKGK